MTAAVHAAPRLTIGYLLRFLLAVICLLGVLLYGTTRLIVGLDTQDYSCLDQRVFFIDTQTRPTAADLEVGDLVAVRLTDAQRPATATWEPRTIMVKRVEASVPGTRITVSRDGISFELDGKRWTHGTALESAAKLGRSEASFERTFELKPGELFLMGDNPMSYDGRYYGPVTEAQVVGAVLWAI